MVMYELTDRGRALLAAVDRGRAGERMSAPVELPLAAPAAARDDARPVATITPERYRRARRVG